jgi:GNAT superfamily N-acetyltransferase
MPAAAADFRRYRPGDGPRIADAWTRAMPSDGITAARLRNLVLLDRNFDPHGLIIAESDDRIVGAAYGVRRLVAEQGADLDSSRGWILFFFVDPAARGRGIGRELLTRVMGWLSENGASKAVFSSYTPNYVLPGLDQDRYPAAAALLESLGFSTIEKADAMSLSLRGYAPPDAERDRADALRAQGWYLGSLRDDDIVPLIAVAGDAFNPDWARAIREGILGGLPLERLIVAKDPSGSVIGWAMHGTYEGVIDRFGPFGVLPQSRGTGLGRLLLHLTLERMVAVGAQTAWFLWADEGSAASNLYQKTGFEITRTFSILSAPIAGGAHRNA